MANRNFASGGKIYSMHVMPVMVNCAITIGAAGAVSSFSSTLASSVVLVSTGVYQINLANNYFAAISIIGAMRSPVSGVSGISTIEIQNNPTASVSSLSAPSITIKTLSDSDAVAAPASGSVIDIMAILSNSSVKA